jgi:DNA-binding transcriptional LysR family regulator
MRQAASTALTQAGLPWRIAFASSHLPAMLGAVSAGTGISVRTKIGLPEGVKVLPKSLQLPALPTVHALLCTAAKEDRRAVTGLKEFLLAEIRKKVIF